ncbi:ethanolamine two-component response regulator [Fictibacillus macauensis ZFHKF-1]|uniref:Ethanolamine two-component response regulator n=1 Tax=Fictibacillus macauensis ZFHKF-1 TaxID=1196324 RepID=I8UIW0_9BACL|nr:response regulator [Fictibacillus macauensis]EIT86768.1 ethanolamine two-component response regulator [Fictibacillus macauensis ZFHKF-1]
MSKGRIMVVDDESILRMDLKEMLSEAGYEIAAEANTGELAIEMAALHQPDLILMDVKMPKMNGIKASRIIEKSFNIPVLLLTAYSQTEDVEDAKKAGIVGYLVKPVTEQQLIPAVEIALAQSQKVKRLLKDMRKLEEKIEERKLIEKAKGIIMETHHLNEESAYQKLRSYCMNHRIVMKQLAQYIITHQSFDFSVKISS